MLNVPTMISAPVAWAVIYLAGVLIGLVRIDAGLVHRMALAVCWPIGPVAFVATVAGLLLVAAIAFPVFGAFVVAAAVLYRLLTSL